jgi:3-epi-6-deoxocathasterone 23-monooxygenase
VLLNDTSEKLTDDLIADNIIDMMIPGEDSVPVLMTLATKYLSECPAALQQLTVRYACMYVYMYVTYVFFKSRV